MFIGGTLIIGGLALVTTRVYNNQRTRRDENSLVLALDEGDIETFEKVVNRNLALTGGTLALTLAAISNPALAIVSRPATVLIALPLVTHYYRSIQERKHVASSIMDISAVIAPIMAGYFVIGVGLTGMHYASQKLLLKTENSSRKSMLSVFGEQPRTVWVEQDGVAVEIPFEDLRVGDTVIVEAGQMIAADGMVSGGSGLVDQRSLTGEGQPVERTIGDGVFASTLLLSGRLHVRVDQAGENVIAVQVNDALHSSADLRATISQRGERVRNQGAFLTMAISGVTLPLYGLGSAIATLYAGFGYSLKYAAPIGMLNGLRVAAQNGLLVKDGRALETLNRVDTFVFDKTGTLTEDVPTVGAIYTANGFGRDYVLTLAAAAETMQTHPFALAILRKAQERELSLPTIDETQVEIGYGLKATIEDQVVRVGSRRFMEMEEIPIGASYLAIEAASHAEGHSLVYVAIGNKLGGLIELHASIRPEVSEIANLLREREIDMIIVSGDHTKPTRKLAQSVRVDSFHAERLPQDKAAIIDQLRATGHTVCFVGDGINDSIALKSADVAISLSGASAIATDTADVLLMDGSLKQLPTLIKLAEQLDNNFSNSVFFSVVPGVLCVAGVYLFNLGIVPAVAIYQAGWLATVANSARLQTTS